MAGQAYLIGAGTTRDAEKAMLLLRTACDLDDPNGCYKLGDVNVGGAFGPSIEPSKGLGFLDKACTLGHSSGCYRAGSTLELGAAGVEKDLARAREYYEKGCGAKKVGSLPVMANSLGQAGSCSRLGMMVAATAKNDSDRSKAESLQRLGREYFARGCDSGTPQDCYVLGGMYEGGEGAPRDRQRAHELFERACNLGIKRACQAAERPASTTDPRS
jgi:TPR repeat protein